MASVEKMNNKVKLSKFWAMGGICQIELWPDLPYMLKKPWLYYASSTERLREVEKEIKDICNLLHCRAYASVNYKLMSQIALDTIAEETRRIAAHDYKQFDHIFESCRGKFVDKNNYLWVVDVDDNKSELFMLKLIKYINSIRSKSKQNVLQTFPTPSGYHLICHPFDFNQFMRMFKLCLGAEAVIPDVKKNHLTLLYENL